MWFHRYPELSNEEFETTKKIKGILIKYKIEVLDLPLETGLVARIQGNKEGPVVMIFI